MSKNKHKEQQRDHDTGEDNHQAEPTGTGALDRKHFEAALETLQIELVKLQTWVVHTGLRVVIIFEGRDAARTRTRLPMADNIALADFSSCHAVQVRAKYLGRIHLFCCCFHIHRLQIDALSFPLPRTSFHQLLGPTSVVMSR